MNILLLLLEALLVALALSLDAFIAAFCYGTFRIKLPAVSVLIISLVCSSCIGAALLSGEVLKKYMPEQFVAAFAFLLLFLPGLAKLMDGLTKNLIRKHGGISHSIRFSLGSLRFVLNLYADPCVADTDHSKTISPKESLCLSFALSLDGFAAGLGAAFCNINGPALVFSSLMVEAAAVLLGAGLGNHAAGRFSCNISWLGGLLLIFIAFLRLL